MNTPKPTYAINYTYDGHTHQAMYNGVDMVAALNHFKRNWAKEWDKIEILKCQKVRN